ncbi:hypothetical protein [Helicobacter fennelliae]|uniref:hypothetical protein n=1 Tax=Helicobacter fennelliae TaxID=215 RepID=UPI0015F28268|nr:hypothetical protein [Helicobacter fennelliae]
MSLQFLFHYSKLFCHCEQLQNCEAIHRIHKVSLFYYSKSPCHVLGFVKAEESINKN